MNGATHVESPADVEHRGGGALLRRAGRSGIQVEVRRAELEVRTHGYRDALPGVPARRPTVTPAINCRPKPRRIQSSVDIKGHFRTTGLALRRWFVAQCYDALAVGAIWLVGLLIIRVPLAPFWALLGGALQFIPNFGPLLAVLGPAIVGGLSGGWERMLYVLILYAIIAVTDGLFLQPYIMKRTVKVPIWASILAPIVLGFVIPFWGVLLAPPLLAVLYTYRGKPRAVAESERRNESGNARPML